MGRSDRRRRPEAQGHGRVSAGAAVACLVVGGETNLTLDYYDVTLKNNPKNFYPAELLRGRTPFPHYLIYSQALNNLITGETLDKLRRGPEIRILIARRRLGSALARR